MPLTTGKNGSFTYISDNPKLPGELSVSVKKGHHWIQRLSPFGELNDTRNRAKNTTVIIKVTSPKPMTLIQEYLSTHPRSEPISGVNSLALIENHTAFNEAVTNSRYDISDFYPTALVADYIHGQYDRICFVVNDLLLTSQQPTPGYLQEIDNETIITKQAPPKKEPFLTPLHWATFINHTKAVSYLAAHGKNASPFDALNDSNQFEPFSLFPIDIAYAVHPNNLTLTQLCSQDNYNYNGHVVNGIKLHTPNTAIDSAKSTRYTEKESMCLCVVS